MITTYPFTEAPQIRLQNNPHNPPNDATLEQVNTIWQQEQAKRKAENRQPLFNGELFCVDDYDDNTLVGHRTEYRFWVAQFLQPQLYAQLNIRPLAVSGLVRCRDGIVFGKRSLSNTTGAGLWELIPSGGVDTQAYHAGELVNVAQQIQLEFHEETGCDPQWLDKITPLCLMENHITHSMDIGLLLSASQLTFAELQKQHKGTHFEYTELQLVVEPQLADYIEQQGPHLVAGSAALAKHWMHYVKGNDALRID
jgi:hypothetical protein